MNASVHTIIANNINEWWCIWARWMRWIAYIIMLIYVQREHRTLNTFAIIIIIIIECWLVGWLKSSIIYDELFVVYDTKRIMPSTKLHASHHKGPKCTCFLASLWLNDRVLYAVVHREHHSLCSIYEASNGSAIMEWTVMINDVHKNHRYFPSFINDRLCALCFVCMWMCQR